MNMKDFSFYMLILMCKRIREVPPSWPCRGRTFESVHGHDNRGEGSRKGPTTINKCKGPTPALCSGNTGLGQGWLCTTCGSSPATIKNEKKGHTFAEEKPSEVRDPNCEVTWIFRKLSKQNLKFWRIQIGCNPNISSQSKEKLQKKNLPKMCVGPTSDREWAGRRPPITKNWVSFWTSLTASLTKCSNKVKNNGCWGIKLWGWG